MGAVGSGGGWSPGGRVEGRGGGRLGLDLGRVDIGGGKGGDVAVNVALRKGAEGGRVGGGAEGGKGPLDGKGGGSVPGIGVAGRGGG